MLDCNLAKKSSQIPAIPSFCLGCAEDFHIFGIAADRLQIEGSTGMVQRDAHDKKTVGWLRNPAAPGMVETPIG